MSCLPPTGLNAGSADWRHPSRASPSARACNGACSRRSWRRARRPSRCRDFRPRARQSRSPGPDCRRGRIAALLFDIERVRRPAAAAADRNAGRVLPSRRIERRRAQRPAHHVALDLGNEEELPDDLAGLRLEREHVPLAALEVSACIADEDEAVRGDRRRGHRLADVSGSAIVVSQICLPVLKSISAALVRPACRETACRRDRRHLD